MPPTTAEAKARKRERDRARQCVKYQAEKQQRLAALVALGEEFAAPKLLGEVRRLHLEVEQLSKKLVEEKLARLQEEHSKCPSILSPTPTSSQTESST